MTILQVMAVQTTYSPGVWNTLCSAVSVARHAACECACRVRPEHCHPNKQIYDSITCQCRCKNQVRKLVRLTQKKRSKSAYMYCTIGENK